MDIFQVGFYNLIRSYDDVLGWFLEYDDPGCFLEYDDDKDQIFKLETYFAGRLVGPRSDEGCRLIHTRPINTGLFYLIIEKRMSHTWFTLDNFPFKIRLISFVNLSCYKTFAML